MPGSHTVPPRHSCPVPVPSWVALGSPEPGSGWPPPAPIAHPVQIPKFRVHLALPPQSPGCSVRILFQTLQASNSKCPKRQGDMQGVKAEKGREAMPEFLGHLLACSPEGERAWLWEGRGLGWVLGLWAGSRVGSSSVGPEAPSALGRGGSVLWRCAGRGRDGRN